ncbi:hypothetical protein [Rubinisphaera italica]|uniref:Uncharacterized protein n=1 Tax=Rubinisphaera italica TaxID=2527969 RepID=A0A5C5XNQ6_9PLAN|nr:hypothetical protein [Rubinisphaera italica]TWT64348.1 hypothetical protein Pan54_51100 [Rubinisphaera italica]
MAEFRHFLLQNTRSRQNYISTQSGGGKKNSPPLPERKTHADKLLGDLARAEKKAKARQKTEPAYEGIQFIPMVFDESSDFDLEQQQLENTSPGARIVSAKERGGRKEYLVAVPDSEVSKFADKFRDYRDKETAKKGTPLNEKLASSVITIDAAELESVTTLIPTMRSRRHLRISRIAGVSGKNASGIHSGNTASALRSRSLIERVPFRSIPLPPVVLVPMGIALWAPECCVGLNEDRSPTTGTICVWVATSDSDLLTVIVQWSTKRIVKRVAAAFLDRLIAFWIEQFHETVRKQPRSLPKQKQRYTETKQQRQSERCENDRRNNPDWRANQKEAKLDKPMWGAVV